MQLLIWFSFSVSLFFQIPQRCYMRIVYAANRPMRAALYTVAWHDKGSNLCQPGHDFYFWIKPFKIGIDLHLLRMIVSSGEVQCGSNNSLQSLSILIVNSKVSHFINHLAGCFFFLQIFILHCWRADCRSFCAVALRKFFSLPWIPLNASLY